MSKNRMDSLLPPMVMPWVRPNPEYISPNQGRAAHQSTMMEHNENLTLDSKRPQALLTSVIATLGANTSEEEVQKIVEAGACALRLDMSNLSREQAEETLIRAKLAVERASEAKGHVIPVAFVIDLKGPFILTGKIKSSRKASLKTAVTLKTGDSVRLTTHPAYDECVTAERVFIDHPTLHQIVIPSTKICLDNGRIELTVRGVVDNDIVCDIVSGGDLGSFKRVQLPGLSLDLPDLTVKDWQDIRLAIAMDVDAIFLPYSVDKETIDNIKDTLGERGKRVLLLTKIETRCCYDRISDILSFSDGVVINRGSLSVEMSTEKVIQVQKTIAAKCNKTFKLVYTMTDILGSMRHMDCPTIAEVTDVTACILDGIDGLVVEEETAIGDHPDLVVRTLCVLCREAETEVWTQEIVQAFSKVTVPPMDPVQAICLSAVDISLKADAAAIIVCTTSGFSARTLAQYRPRCPIIAVTRYGCVARAIALYRSIWPVNYLEAPHPCWPKEVDRRLQRGTHLAKLEGFIRPGDLLVLISAWRQGSGYTNQMRIVYASPNMEQWVLPRTDDNVVGGVNECHVPRITTENDENAKGSQEGKPCAGKGYHLKRLSNKN